MLVSEIEKKAEIRRQTASAIRSADIGMSSNRGQGEGGRWLPWVLGAAQKDL